MPSIRLSLMQIIALKLKQLASTNERHLRNFTFMKYQETNGWLETNEETKGNLKILGEF